MTYLQEVFYPSDLEAAKRLVLPPDSSDPNKFENETRFLVSFIKERGLIATDSMVLDFGCGMGRLGKALIEEFTCTVVGTDISSAMLELAREYVADDRFVARERPEGVFDIALAVLVLQHVQYPEHEVEHLYDSLHQDGLLLVVNEPRRFVPSGVDAQGYVIWTDDGVSVDSLLSQRFVLEGRYPYYRRDDFLLSLWRKK